MDSFKVGRKAAGPPNIGKGGRPARLAIGSGWGYNVDHVLKERRMLKSFAEKSIAAWSAADIRHFAEDIAQDSLLSVRSNLESFRGEARPVRSGTRDESISPTSRGRRPMVFSAFSPLSISNPT